MTKLWRMSPNEGSWKAAIINAIILFEHMQMIVYISNRSASSRLLYIMNKGCILELTGYKKGIRDVFSTKKKSKQYL